MTKSLYEKRVKDVMSRNVVTIDAKDTIHDALQLMSENRVSTLPVVDSRDHCIGVISASDLMEVTAKVEQEIEELDRSADYIYGLYAHLMAELADDLGHKNVMELMSESAVCAGPDDLIAVAASRMLKDRIHRLPVVHDGRVIGIVSTTDLLSAFVESAPKLANC